MEEKTWEEMTEKERVVKLNKIYYRDIYGPKSMEEVYHFLPHIIVNPEDNDHLNYIRFFPEHNIYDYHGSFLVSTNPKKPYVAVKRSYTAESPYLPYVTDVESDQIDNIVCKVKDLKSISTNEAGEPVLNYYERDL